MIPMRRNWLGLRRSASLLKLAPVSCLALVAAAAADSGLRGPVAGPLIDVSGLPGNVTAAALDRSGSTILLAATESGAGAVFLLRADSPAESPAPRFLLRSPAPAALLFVNGDRDAMVADRSSN